jgi:hypothetical protein
MGHMLHAVIGPETPVARFAGSWVLARLVHLPQGFALVPLTAALHDDIADLANLRKADPFLDFERLSAGVEFVLRVDISHVGPVAYVETDYFGGYGTQKVWNKQEVFLGPLKTESRGKAIEPSSIRQARGRSAKF